MDEKIYKIAAKAGKQKARKTKETQKKDGMDGEMILP